MDRAFETGALLRESDQFLAEKAQNSSPMMAVQHFERVMQFNDQLDAMQSRIQKSNGSLYAHLQRLNTAWLVELAAGSPERSARLPLPELQEIYQRYAFQARWSGQIRERISRLAIS